MKTPHYQNDLEENTEFSLSLMSFHYIFKATSYSFPSRYPKSVELGWLLLRDVQTNVIHNSGITVVYLIFCTVN